MQNLIPAYCAALGINPQLLLSKVKTAQLLKKRQALYHFLRYQAQLSYPQIGQLMGRDHSTVLTGLRSFEKQLQDDPKLARWYAGLKDQFMNINQKAAA